MPKVMPEPTVIDERRMIVALTPSLVVIQEHRDKVEKARERLAHLRRLPGVTAEVAHSSSESGPPTAANVATPPPELGQPTTAAGAAREYYDLAREWYGLAQNYTGPDAEQAQAIRQVAARSLAEAAAEFRRESFPVQQGEGPSVQELRTEASMGAPLEAPAEPAVRDLFWQVLAWEREAKKWLEKVGAAEEERCRLADEVDTLFRLHEQGEN
jgi:hypothetical protein